MALEGEVLIELSRLDSDPVPRSASNRNVFSFVGEVEEPVNLSIAPSMPMSRAGSESLRGSILGESDRNKELA